MILIPLHRKPDWSRPPWVTVVLILLNLLILMLYQSDDDDHLMEAVHIYQSHELLALEQPAYRIFLSEQKLTAPALDIDEEFSWQIAFDRNFDLYLRDYWQREEFANDQHTVQWREARLAFEAERDQISSVRAGLTPTDDRWWTYITSIFLHGGWEHLIGNMVFLFLFGLTLEMALGPALYGLLFIACGIAAGGLHVVLHPTSTVPLVGASGAISGLMGMYVALYRLQSIRFFYTVFFYFGEFRAPAILVLPLWLGKEIYGHFFTDSNVAYMAHFGGLIAGALVMIPLARHLVTFQQEEQLIADDDEVASGLARIQAAIGTLDFDRARALANQLSDKYPHSVQIWRKRFDLAKRAPHSEQFHEVMRKCAQRFIEANTAFNIWRDDFESMLKEYADLSPQTPALDGDCYLALAHIFWQKGWRERAEQLLRVAIAKGAEADQVSTFIELCSNEYRRLGNVDKARYIEALNRQSTSTD